MHVSGGGDDGGGGDPRDDVMVVVVTAAKGWTWNVSLSSFQDKIYGSRALSVGPLVSLTTALRRTQIKTFG